jgi:arsenite methyltransferase
MTVGQPPGGSARAGAAVPDPREAGASQARSLESCCATLYESEIARWLLGESFHPGGLVLTDRLCTRLGLRAEHKVLDVAAGRGTSALHLAQRYGCEVVGVDFGAQNVAVANAEAAARGLGRLARFREADARSLPFADGTFDVVICECAFCLFADKPRAARELARVLAPDGRLGVSDLTRAASLAAELDGLLAWIACIADAQTPEQYRRHLRDAGFVVEHVEPHGEALRQLVQQVQGKLLAAEALRGWKQISLRQVDFDAARAMARAAAEAISRGELGYALITAVKARPTEQPG